MKVRSDVSSEYWLNAKCAYPDRQLFDWGMMRLRRPLYGVGDPFAMDADDQLKKKREAEVTFFSSSVICIPPLPFCGFELGFHIMDIIDYSYICRC